MMIRISITPYFNKVTCGIVDAVNKSGSINFDAKKRVQIDKQRLLKT